MTSQEQRACQREKCLLACAARVRTLRATSDPEFVSGLRFRIRSPFQARCELCFELRGDARVGVRGRV
jgi:hypothetical protein